MWHGFHTGRVPSTRAIRDPRRVWDSDRFKEAQHQKGHKATIRLEPRAKRTGPSQMVSDVMKESSQTIDCLAKEPWMGTNSELGGWVFAKEWVACSLPDLTIIKQHNTRSGTHTHTYIHIATLRTCTHIVWVWCDVLQVCAGGPTPYILCFLHLLKLQCTPTVWFLIAARVAHQAQRCYKSYQSFHRTLANLIWKKLPHDSKPKTWKQIQKLAVSLNLSQSI